MAAKYLDTTGLQYFWGKVKAWAKRMLVSTITYDGEAKAIKMTKWNGTNDTENTTSVVSASTIVTDGGGITSHQDISGKADKVSGATSGNFAGLDSNGNLTDSGHKHSDYLTSHQDISGKADKAVPTAAGNVAILNASGNLADSEKTLGVSVPVDAVFTDTKNTAGSTNKTSTKMYIIAASEQSDNPQTYSKDTIYIGTDGHLYSNDIQVVNLSGTQTLTNKTLTSPSISDPIITGTPTAPTATAGTNTTQIATTEFVTSAISTASGSYVATSSVGVASGVCPLDSNALIDSQYLPSYVDDIVEAYARDGQTELSSTWLATGSASGTVITPETGKIYVLMNDTTNYSANTQFRWSGTTYVKLNDGGVSAITNSEIDTITAS